MKYFKEINGIYFYVKDWKYDPIMIQVVDIEHTHEEKYACEIQIPLIKALLCDLEYRALPNEYKIKIKRKE